MGIPFCGFSKICENEKHPIGIIVLLKQGEHNNIRQISTSEAYKRIISEVTINIWDKEFFIKVSDIVMDLINCVEIIELTCLPNEEIVNSGYRERRLEEWLELAKQCRNAGMLYKYNCIWSI